MKFGWIEVLLIMLATAVATVVGMWAWEEIKTWRVNREYGPNNRRSKTAGRRRTD